MRHSYLGSRKSKYSGVYIINAITDGKPYILYHAKKKIKGIIYQKYFYDEKEAAKYIDLVLIKLGKDPINILKRK